MCAYLALAASFEGQGQALAILLFSHADITTRNKQGLTARNEARGDSLDFWALWEQYQSAPFIDPGSENVSHNRLLVELIILLGNTQNTQNQVSLNSRTKKGQSRRNNDSLIIYSFFMPLSLDLVNVSLRSHVHFL